MKKRLCVVFIAFMLLFQYLYINVSAEELNIKFSRGYELFLKESIPEETETYFNSIYDVAIEAYIYCNCKEKIEILEELKVGTAFVIHNIETITEDVIWYFPIYNKDEIFLLISVYRVNGKYSYSISDEFVEILNKIEYSSDMILIQDSNNIFAYDLMGEIYSINNSYKEIPSEKLNYEEVYEQVLKLWDNNVNGEVKSATVINNNLLSNAPIVTTPYGAECDMNGCFVKQYDYSICWAATVASIVRHKTTNPLYYDINAFDVAYKVGEYEGIDTSTLQGKMACLIPRVPSDAHLALALYGVYYTLYANYISLDEIKAEIISSNPIYMHSQYYSKEEKKMYAHVTVLYGYYRHGGVDFIQIWNPGDGSKKMISYIPNEGASYTYNGCVYLWMYTIANGYYLYK